MSAVAHVMTQLYKRSLPYEGDVQSFPVRKQFARDAADLIAARITLLPVTNRHMTAAAKAFLALSDRDVRDAYAGFQDYLDAASILDPPDSHEVTHAAMNHVHLKYILQRQKWTGVYLVMYR